MQVVASEDASWFSGSMEGNFFQSLDFHKALQQIGWKTIVLRVRKRNCQATVLGFAPKNVPVFHNLFPSYRVLYGPCMHATGQNFDLVVLNYLLRDLCHKVKQDGAIFLSVATPFPFPHAYEIFRRNGFARVIVKGEYSVFIDLRKDLDTLWKEMKRFARRSVKKAIKKGVRVRSVETEVELQQFYNMYQETAARRGFYPFPYRLFATLWTQLEPKGLVKFFVAWLGKQPIGGILNTFYAKESVPYIACSLKRFWNYYPNHLLFYHSLKWSKEVADSSIFKFYHLPPKKESGHGIDYYTFKTCFGGHLVEERTIYHKIIAPTRFRLAQMCQSKLWNSRVGVPVRAFVKQVAFAFN